MYSTTRISGAIRRCSSAAHTWEAVKIGQLRLADRDGEGWLVITHGVGAMRKICIGALLLDLDDPSRSSASRGTADASESNTREG